MHEQGHSIVELSESRKTQINFLTQRKILLCFSQKQAKVHPKTCLNAYLTLPHDIYPRALAFSPCGKYLASGLWWNRSVKTEKVPIRLWEVAAGENIATFWGHPTDVQDLAFSPDGTLLASGSFDCTILLWDLKPVMGS